MGDIDYTFDSSTHANTGASDHAPYNIKGDAINISKVHIDMAAVKAAHGTFAYTDVLQFWDIPYPCWIMGVWVKVTTAEGAVSTGSVGINSTADYTFVHSIDWNAAAYYLPTDDETYAAIFGKFFSSADTLDAYFGATGTEADVGTLVFDVYIAWVDCSSF
jgi:hypothetical protein